MAKGGRWTGAIGSEVAEMARADLLRLRPLESRVRRKLQARFGGRLMEKARKGPRQEPTPPEGASVSSDTEARHSQGEQATTRSVPKLVHASQQ